MEEKQLVHVIKMKRQNKKIIQILFLIFVILISGLLIYKVHYNYSGLIQDPHINQGYSYVNNSNYPFPIHADEWTHLAQVEAIMKGNLFKNPYSYNSIIHIDFEVGFHLFLALFFKITTLDPVLNYQFLPALFFMLNSILLFFFIKKLTKNYYIALLSIPFFLAIPSNINFLGNWFAIPLTFSVFSIYLFFICFTKFIDTYKKKYFVYTVLAYILSLIYPMATVLITLITFFYLILEVKIYKKYKKYKFLFIFSSIIILLGLFLFWKLSFIIFHRDWTSFQYNYSLIFFYGFLPTLFAIFGIYFSLKKKYNKILLIWPTICLLNLLLYRLIDFGFFIPYERTMYYYLLGLAPLAAIGLFNIIQLFYSKTKKISFKYKKILTLFFITILILTIFFFVFKNYYTPQEKSLTISHLIEEQDYSALKFIEQTYGNGNIILADNLISIAIYPISQNYVIAIQDSNVGYGNPNIPSLFFKFVCEDKKEILNKYNVNFVLSRFKIECDFLDEVYNQGDYVYRVK